MTVISGILVPAAIPNSGFICDGITMWCVTVPIGLIAAFVLKLPVLTVYILINVDDHQASGSAQELPASITG